jgi:putative nucleotidyltransferase with HDIG domain
VAALGRDELHDLAESVPAAAFPWRTPAEALMHRLRVHSLVVARASERIARQVRPTLRDELLAAALLHDVGKLVIARARGEFGGVGERSTLVPEERVRRERRELGTDHANLGSLLLVRWRLPDRLADAVAAHHRAQGAEELATLVRLADMVAHQAQGGAVDRRVMLSLATACGLGPRELRDVIFDLPHVGGSRRRRAEHSPLSTQETAVLQHLAQGKLYKQIAEDLGLSASTVRSHLHNAYRKLEVPDRAQAVLRATEMAWI